MTLNELRGIQRLLAPGQVVLHYELASDDVLLYQLELHGEPRLLRVGRTEELVTLTRQWESLIDENDGNTISRSPDRHARQLLSQLSGRLLPPLVVARLEQSSGLIVVPDGPLFSVPFAVLPTPDGRILGTIAGGVCHAPNLSTYRLCRQKSAKLGHDSIHLTPSSIVSPPSRQYFLAPPLRDMILFVDGDGAFDGARPSASWIECADGRITSAELYPAERTERWKRIRTLVCLTPSSARTGATSGGERAGIAWSALARGAAQFIGLLWPVPKETRAAFWERLRETSQECDSLSRAMSNALFSPSHFENPLAHDASLDWGSFCLFGSDQ